MIPPGFLLNQETCQKPKDRHFTSEPSPGGSTELAILQALFFSSPNIEQNERILEYQARIFKPDHSGRT
jgi:hypothetical protein